ncbi:hypothetical protein OCAE111667_26300 [Occultella aeris]|uniref:Uncharacterized protein n=1 Tax=Occultella aeris TaxID=2761496 RepID=A0A7M4DNJ2_9MICO|nr:hypothetical protein HALOF300_03722 [Occultella aeris]
MRPIGAAGAATALVISSWHPGSRAVVARSTERLRPIPITARRANSDLIGCGASVH